MAEMDRKANNDRLRAIVQRRRDEAGAVPALEVATLINELTGLLDELIEAAYTEGLEDAQ